MCAFALDAFDQPGSNHDLPDPQPAGGQVRVRVAAASLNPFDNFVIQGYGKDMIEHRFPLIPAGDLAGRVDALGPDVTGFPSATLCLESPARCSRAKARWRN